MFCICKAANRPTDRPTERFFCFVHRRQMWMGFCFAHSLSFVIALLYIYTYIFIHCIALCCCLIRNSKPVEIDSIIMSHFVVVVVLVVDVCVWERVDREWPLIVCMVRIITLYKSITIVFGLTCLCNNFKSVCCYDHFVSKSFHQKMIVAASCSVCECVPSKCAIWRK